MGEYIMNKEENKAGSKHRVLTVIGIIAALVLVFGGPVMGASCIFCGSACAAGSAESYPFIHETGSFEDVTIEAVTVEYLYDEESGGRLSFVPAAEIRDKDAFLEEFSSLRFIHPFGDPIFTIHSGKGFCFTWPDGQVEVVTSWGCGLFTDRSLAEEIGHEGMTSEDEKFDALWDKWAQP